MEDHAGTPGSLGHVLDLKISGADAAPTHRLLGLKPRSPALDGNAIGHNEARIKTHAKLPDELGVTFLVTGQAAHELTRATLGNGAQVRHGFLA